MMIEARALPSAAGDAEDAERLLESIQYPLIERLQDAAGEDSSGSWDVLPHARA